MKIWSGIVIFVLGVGAGFTGLQFIPASVSPYLPAALQAQNEVVKGIVVRKHQEQERLLLTVSTPRGALLATFTQQIPEIELLVEEGDEVTLGLAQYSPFIHDPVIKGVMKPDQFSQTPILDSGPADTNSPALDSDATPDLSEEDVVDPQI